MEARFKIVGKVVAVDNDIATVETNIKGMTGQTYTDVYPVVLGAGVEDAGALVGKRMGFVGEITPEIGGTAFLKATSLAQAPDGVADCNRGKIAGTVLRFDDMPAIDGKRQLGNLAIIHGEGVLNAVAWRGAVSKLRAKGVKQGAEVEIAGRLRMRSFTVQGEPRVTVELSCDQSGDVVVKNSGSGADDFSLDFEKQTISPRPLARQAFAKAQAAAVMAFRTIRRV